MARMSPLALALGAMLLLVPAALCADIMVNEPGFNRNADELPSYLDNTVRGRPIKCPDANNPHCNEKGKPVPDAVKVDGFDQSTGAFDAGGWVDAAALGVKEYLPTVEELAKLPEEAIPNNGEMFQDALERALAIPGPIVFPGPFPWKGLVFNPVNSTWSNWQTVCVSVGQAPVDVVFLADTTGSMYSPILAVQTAAASIYASLSGSLTNLAIGVAGYKDHLSDGPVTNAVGGPGAGFWNIQPLTTAHSGPAFSSWVGSWAAGGGGDWPEDPLWALGRLAQLPWRANSIRMIVWFGDAPSHNPSGSGASSPSWYTQTNAQALLTAAGIRVHAVDVGAMDIWSQASSLATATGGTYAASVNPSALAATIVSTVLSTTVSINPVITCTPSFGLTIDIVPIPPAPNVTVGQKACWRIRVRVCDDQDCTPRTFTCQIKWYNAATNGLIAVTPITVIVPGIDTTPPTFTPAFPPFSFNLPCPSE